MLLAAGLCVGFVTVCRLLVLRVALHRLCCDVCASGEACAGRDLGRGLRLVRGLSLRSWCCVCAGRARLCERRDLLFPCAAPRRRWKKAHFFLSSLAFVVTRGNPPTEKRQVHSKAQRQADRKPSPRSSVRFHIYQFHRGPRTWHGAIHLAILSSHLSQLCLESHSPQDHPHWAVVRRAHFGPHKRRFQAGQQGPAGHPVVNPPPTVDLAPRRAHRPK